MNTEITTKNIIITVTPTCRCGKTGKPQDFPLTSIGVKEMKKAENKLYECPKCKVKVNAKQTLRDSVIDYELRKMGVSN